MELTFSDRQARTIASAITLVAAAVILGAVGAILWLTASFLRAYSSVFLPLAVGGIAALVVRPYYAWLHERLHLPASVALAAVFVSLLLPFTGFVWFFGALMAEQLIELASQVPAWWKQLATFVKERWPSVMEFLQSSPYALKLQRALEAQQDQLLGGLQAFGARALSAGASLIRGIGTLFSWAVLPVYFAFFLMAKPKSFDAGQLLPFLKPETRKDVVYLVEEFVNIVVAFFRGQLIIAFIQGLLFATGLSLVGLAYGFVIGLTLGFLNIIPYLGSILGLTIALPLSFFQADGGLGRLIAVIVVFVIVQLTEGYFLTPKIMGERTGLHFMAIIVAVFFWGAALGGILGVILAIPLTAFLVSLWRLAKEKYISELV